MTCLNRFFVSESFRSDQYDRERRVHRFRLNRFFVSESFRSLRRRAKRVYFHEVSIASSSANHSGHLFRYRGRVDLDQVSIASSSANHPGRDTTPVNPPGPIESQSLLRQRIIQVVNLLPPPEPVELSLNRFFVSESFRSETMTQLGILQELPSQSLLRQRIIQVGLRD